MSFSEGDFVKIEYNLWRSADGQLMRTTDKKLAEEKEIFNEEASYTPQLIILGKDNSIKTLSVAIKEMSVGEKKVLELEPKEAFGERDPELVRIMPISDFRKKDIEPRPGMQIDIDGVIATIKSVNSGRVMVDANNILAGEKVRYEIKVVGKADTEDEKMRALAERYLLDPLHVSVREGVAKITFGPKTKINGEYFINKAYLVNDVLEYMKEVRKVEVTEEYERRKE